MEVQEAVKKASDHLRRLYEGQDIRQMLLEEVEKDGPDWRVTLSFFYPDPSSAVSGIFTGEFIREYKTLILDSYGNLVSMRIRKL